MCEAGCADSKRCPTKWAALLCCCIFVCELFSDFVCIVTLFVKVVVTYLDIVVVDIVSANLRILEFG